MEGRQLSPITEYKKLPRSRVFKGLARELSVPVLALSRYHAP